MTSLNIRRRAEMVSTQAAAAPIATHTTRILRRRLLRILTAVNVTKYTVCDVIVNVAPSVVCGIGSLTDNFCKQDEKAKWSRIAGPILVQLYHHHARKRH